MATQQGSARRPRVGGGGGNSEERFRAAFKIISDTVTKLDLDQDVREAAQVPRPAPHILQPHTVHPRSFTSCCHAHAHQVEQRLQHCLCS